MNFNEYSQLFVTGASGLLLGEHPQRVAEKTSQQTANIQRNQESRRRSFQAEGIGEIKNESQKSLRDNGFNGQEFSYQSKNSTAPYLCGRSLDPTGKVGRHLDVLG